MGKLYYAPILKVTANFVIFGRNPSGLPHSLICVENGIRRFFGKQAGFEKVKISEAGIKEAQAALLDYLHSTRGIRFADAENMSFNAKFFLVHLMDKIEITDQEVGKSVARFLRYHPINEFEPFFESLGLRPCEVSPLLPRCLTFLSDDQLLLDNYYTLCDFGIPKNKIGKIYEGSRGLFELDSKTLVSMLQASLKLGFSRTFFPLFLSRTPQIVSNKPFEDVTEVMNIIKSCGIEVVRIEEHLKRCRVYRWNTVLRVLQFFMMNGYKYHQLGKIIEEHPDIVFYKCGHTTLSLIAFLSKFGLSLSEISSTLLQVRNVHLELFYRNLRRFSLPFSKIGMDVDSIGRLFRSHVQTLGCCGIKTPRTLMKQLKVGKSPLTRMIIEDPERLRIWAVGSKLEPLDKSTEKKAEELAKLKFLLSIGCEENPPGMGKMLKKIHGNSSDLQERFDLLVRAGMSREDACSMVRRYPQIICQTVDVLETKLRHFVDVLKYPLSEVVGLPVFLCYAPERIKLRLSMYELHKTVRRRKREAAVATVMSCPDEEFVNRYVRKYPNGMVIWEELKNKFYAK